MSTPGMLMEPEGLSSTTSDSEAGLISVVIPVVERADDLHEVYRTFADALDQGGYSYEFLFVFDGRFTPPPELLALVQDQHAIRILRFAREFGETAALRNENVTRRQIRFKCACVERG